MAKKAGETIPAVIAFLDQREMDGINLCSLLEIACPVACCLSREKPEQVRVGYAGPNRLSVTWITSLGAPLPQFLRTPRGEITATTISHDRGMWRGLVHMAYVDAEEALLYSVGSPVAWSDTYRTVSPSTNPAGRTRALVIADMGASNESNATVESLARHVHDPADNIQFVLHAGDIAYADGVEEINDRYGRKVAAYTTGAPTIACPGNHEMVHNFTSYKTRHAATTSDVAGNDGAMYHLSAIGPAVYVAISTESPINTPFVGEPQLEWLAKALAHARALVEPNRRAVGVAIANATRAAGRPLRREEKEAVAAGAAKGPVWVVVYGHRPMYCTGVRGGWPTENADCTTDTEYLRGRLEALFTRHEVDVVIAGHRHNSERTYPICGTGVDQERKVHRYPELPRGPWPRVGCPMYIVSGASGSREGREKDFSKDAPEWSVPESRMGIWSHGVMDVTPFAWRHTLHSTDDGMVIDDIELTIA